ncbi:MAG TPA: hypothetical protein VIF57_09330 [Polyangia bacterium]
MRDTQPLALLTREAFRSAFKLGDVIPFATKKGTLTVVEFNERGMRVRSASRAEGYLLDFDKLGVVVKDFSAIPSRAAHDGVGAVLKRHGLFETQTETLLYAAAKEFIVRSGLPKGEHPSRDVSAVTEAMNRVADHTDTRADPFLAVAAAARMQDSEW